MKKLFYTFTIFLISNVVIGQEVPKFLQKAMAAQQPSPIQFFLDEGLTQEVSEIPDGTFEVFIKAPLKKNLTSKCGDYTKVEVAASWDNPGGRTVYKKVDDTGMTMNKLFKSQGYYTTKIDFTHESNANLFRAYLEDDPKKKINLFFELGGGRNQNNDLSKGTLVLDISNGIDKWMDYLLSQRSDFTFNATDAFKDDDLKARVIADFESRFKIKIYQFAWGERVPYTGDDLRFYRRHSAGMTFAEEDGYCYKSGVSVYDVSTNPSAYGYSYENDGSRSNVERIPCERAQ